MHVYDILCLFYSVCGGPSPLGLQNRDALMLKGRHLANRHLPTDTLYPTNGPLPQAGYCPRAVPQRTEKSCTRVILSTPWLGWGPQEANWADITIPNLQMSKPSVKRGKPPMGTRQVSGRGRTQSTNSKPKVPCHNRWAKDMSKSSTCGPRSQEPGRREVQGEKKVNGVHHCDVPVVQVRKLTATGNSDTHFSLRRRFHILANQGVQAFGISGPHWEKKSCLRPHIKYTNTNENR